MRARLAAALTVVAAVTGCAQSRLERDHQLRTPVRGMKWAVTGGSDGSVDAGVRLLQAGGNAVDGGVAAMLAASVTEYSHFGFGGEAPLLIRTGQGKVVSIAGVGTMPKLASADLFRSRRLRPGEVMEMEPNGLKSFVPVAGLMPALVPGMVEAALVALREFGTKSFGEVIAPAIELADGNPIDETRAATLNMTRRFAELWPTTKAAYFREGRPVRVGEILRQTQLAATMRAMAAAEKQALAAGKSRAEAIDAVRDYFYRGEIARKIDAFSKAHQGLLRYEDMAAFRLTPEEARAVTYRGLTVYKPDFWSQGPTFLQALNLLEGFDLKAMGFQSPTYLHTLIEALKLAYADRDTFYGDPKFAKVPGDALLSKDYAERRRAEIGEQASKEFRPGEVAGYPARHPIQEDIARVKIDDALMARDTTCINVVDKDGVMFSATPSGAWLPSVIAGDTGIPLTQRAQSFLLVPGHANELAPGKRPRVTLSPTLVTRDGAPYLALATPGGDNQEQSLLQVMLNIVEFGMNAQQAVEAPRAQTRHLVSSFDNHAMNPGEVILDERIAAPIRDALAAKGHRVEQRNRWSSGAAPTVIRVTPLKVLEAGADPYAERFARAW